MYLSQENTTESHEMLSVTAEMVQRMGQLPYEKSLWRLRLLPFQEDLAEVGLWGLWVRYAKLRGQRREWKQNGYPPIQ